MSRAWREGDPCGLFIDLSIWDPAPMPGDWIATEPGARYLITSTRLVKSRRDTGDRKRWQLRVVRLAYGVEVPTDVRCIWLAWYRRNRGGT